MHQLAWTAVDPRRERARQLAVALGDLQVAHHRIVERGDSLDGCDRRRRRDGVTTRAVSGCHEPTITPNPAQDLSLDVS